ncbi:OLC1v1032468C2 [Oldenlandia corymbosa var. corymbosa]|uniref:OLC1v1032468C2 n=1 Tax=Oldenlandia corymbosa var. corymbosa TaxID=529605 RepID=A0AAV1CLU1_OLDCO|nr:OLC1v1032468C2 [Oldenlandia corymbosa var. corymbosa]
MPEIKIRKTSPAKYTSVLQPPERGGGAMSLLNLHHQCFNTPKILHIPKTTRFYHSNFQFNPTHNKPRIPCSSLLIFNCRNVKGLADTEAPMWTHKDGGEEADDKNGDFELEYLAPDGEVYQRTLRLVECAMFSAVSGLTYLLSNSLAIENYFGCFFALPIVFSAMRWGVSAARKTMVATFVLLFVLSGPVKALTYLLMHGFLGFAMGSMWRCRASWGLSIFFCAAVGFFLHRIFLFRSI